MVESLALIWSYASRCLHSIVLIFLAAIVIGVVLTSNSHTPRTFDINTHHDAPTVSTATP